jgi:hypothetical protein
VKVIRKISYLSPANSKQSVPFIRISGKWLQQLGFNIGDQFTIQLTNNQIILQLNKEVQDGSHQITG